METQVKKRADVKRVNYCHSITNTPCPSVSDCFGSGPTIRYHFMHLFPELSLAFSFFTPVFYFASSVGLFVLQSISTIKTLSAITKQSSEIFTLHEKGICIES